MKDTIKDATAATIGCFALVSCKHMATLLLYFFSISTWR